jgi:hypothetical protein
VRRNPDHDPRKAEIKAGADLYARLGNQFDPDLRQRRPEIWSKHDPAQHAKAKDYEIPIFERRLYRYYLQMSKLMENVPENGDLSISVSIHEFKQDIEWPNPGNRWICVRNVESDYYKEYFEGSVLDTDSGQIVGKFTMCRISNYLRRARVVVHREKGVINTPGYDIPETEDEQPERVREDGKPPLYDVEPKKAWERAFKKVGWKITFDFDTPALESSNEGTWTIGELQFALYKIRLQQIIAPANQRTASLVIESKPFEIPFQKVVEEFQKTHKSEQEVRDYIKQLFDLYNKSPHEIRAFLTMFPDVTTLLDPLDTEWTYHLLCVPRIEGVDRGVMFDPYGADSENLPREGAAIAAKWSFGEDANKLRQAGSTAQQTEQADQIDLKWGDANGSQLQNVPAAYFRVGVHEIGHAMGLEHNLADDGFMNTTDSIADDNLEELNENLTVQNAALQAIDDLTGLRDPSGAIDEVVGALPDQDLAEGLTPQNQKAVKAQQARKLIEKAQNVVRARASQLLQAAQKQESVQPFPFLIKQHFQAKDLNQLRFGPDVTIRPGTSYHDFGPLKNDVQPVPADGLKLEASSLLHTVPFGAPARIKVTITNTSNRPKHAPISLSLKSGAVSGSVFDPENNEHSFWPLKRAEDSDPGGVLAPDESRTYTMTLLRGAQKALFPMVGDHQVRIRATWQRNGEPVFLETRTKVRVTAPVDDDHLATALKVLSTPDALFSLVIAGDHLIEGNRAIEAAVNNPILGPHFSIINAKRWLVGPREIDPEKACDFIHKHVIMSFDEIESILKLLERKYTPERAGGSKKLHATVLYLEAKLKIVEADVSIELSRQNAVKDCLKRLKERAENWPKKDDKNGDGGHNDDPPPSGPPDRTLGARIGDLTTAPSPTPM